VTGQKPKKRKGKAKKPAAGADNNVNQNGPSASATVAPQKYVIKAHEIVPLAQSIVESKEKTILIPLGIIKTFKNCIVQRSRTAKWYELDPEITEEDKSKNVSHAYFIEVLKEALQVLVPISKLQQLEKEKFKLSRSEKVQVSTPGADDVPVNKYAHLEIQDIDEEAYEALEDVSTVETPAPVQRKKYEMEALDADNEWILAMSCFFDDIDVLRDDLRGYWEEYAEGDLDLTTAAVTTNTAIEMVKKAEEEFRKLKKPKSFLKYGDDSIPFIWFVECCIQAGVEQPPNAHGSSKFFVPISAWEQVQESYLLLYRLVVIYFQGIRTGSRGGQRAFPVTRPAWLGTYNPALKWDKISDERQYEQVCALVMDMLVTLGAFTQFSNTPNDDMLTKGISELQEWDIEPPMWFLFAVQNYVDVHDVLKTKIERPYEELRDYAVAARRTILDHQHFMSQHPVPAMRTDADELEVSEILAEIKAWALDDKMKQILTEGTMNPVGRKTRVWRDFEILRMSPSLCGMWKYCFHIQLQWKGIRLVNDTGLVTAAHLYNALQQNGYLEKGGNKLVWHDMEYLLELHRKEDTFMGTRPKTIEECTRRLALVQGVSTQTFARPRQGREACIAASRNGSKFLKPSTVVAEVLGNRYMFEWPNGREWHLKELDDILQIRFENIRTVNAVFEQYMDAKMTELDLSSDENKNKFLSVFGRKPGAEEEWTDPVNIRLNRLLAEAAAKLAGRDSAWAQAVDNIVHGRNITPPGHQSTKDISTSAGASQVSKAEEADEPYDFNGLADKIAAAWPKPEKGEQEDEDRDDDDDQDTLPASLPSHIPVPWSALAHTEEMERWNHTKTLPMTTFISLLRDSLTIENLHIQFDYFAFFRSTFSLLLDIQAELLPGFEQSLSEVTDPKMKELANENEGAAACLPHLALLAACDPTKAPNLFVIRPWLGVQTTPPKRAAKIMRRFIYEHGDDYCHTETQREIRRAEKVTSEAPKLRYIDEDDETEDPNEQYGFKEGKLGYTSSVGLIEGLSAREMVEVFDAMKAEGPTGVTTQEMIDRFERMKAQAEEESKEQER